MTAPERMDGRELVIVTGAGRGIGRTVAIALASPQRTVLAISRTDTCRETAAEIAERGGVADAIRVDLADTQAAYDAVTTWLHGSDATKITVVLAAGVLGPSGGVAEAPSLADWEVPYRVNLLGNLAVLKAALPKMIAARYGRVVALAGGGAAYGYPEFSAYACSKTAVVREIENLGKSYPASSGLVFVALAPGAVETDMLARVRAEGGSVRTTTSASETADFVRAIMEHDSSPLSGRFIHVRDTWRDVLSGASEPLDENHWRLRRIE